MSRRTGLKAERQLILLAAGTEGYRRSARAKARALIGEVDRAQLTAALRARRLLPTLGPRILELADGRAGSHFTADVEESIEAARRQALLLQAVGMRVESALGAAGIRSTSLKGPRLGEALYGDPGRRLSSDIDLLVAAEQLQAAADVVHGLGYEPPVDHVGADGLPLLHLALVHERGELPPVELHWRVHWYEQRFAQERLLAASEDRPGSRPARVDELAALLLFYARDGFIDLRQAADLSAWWDRCGDELEPGAMDELLELYPALARVLTVSATVAQKTVGLPANRIIGELSRLRLRDRAAVRLANPNPRAGPRQLYADRGLIDGLLMPPGDLAAFMRRQVFLPREVLEERARRTPERRLGSVLGHTGRVLIRCGVLGRYGMTLTRVARAPETVV